MAALLGVSGRTIDRLAASGQLRRVRIGRVVRFELADVLELVERGREE